MTKRLAELIGRVGLALALAQVIASCRLQVRPSAPPDQHVAPEFTLRDHRDQEVSLAGLLSQGPAVITFYRGYW